ncbi:MAG: type II toxin-antitoxin system RelE/ParE family toxin [Deltaproteobacteria bacterium]|nr:MAG: type II toxin-antitoxin system RelE/ParE family toxin [Deltaproteobacteria bacterium]
MSSVKFTSGALHDLGRLHNFLRSKNPAASKKAAKIIVQSIRILEQYPQIGRPRDDMNPEYRELVIGFGHHGYVALYRLDGGSAIVVAIRHQLEAGYEANNG